MKKLLVILATGFEEVELVTVVDYLRRSGIEVHMASIMDELEIEGAHGIRIRADLFLDQVDHRDYDGIYSPGGLPGAYNIRDDERVLEIYRKMDNDGKLLSALCAGPTVLDRAGLLESREYTCYPGFEVNIKDGKRLDQGLVEDRNIITGMGPALAGEFSFLLIEKLLGPDRRREIEEDTLYNLI